MKKLSLICSIIFFMGMITIPVLAQAPCGSDADCDDLNPCTTESCVEVAEAVYECMYRNNTEPCDDNNSCTEYDTCADGSCTGTPVVCDDGDSATLDSCDPVTGECTYSIMWSVDIKPGTCQNPLNVRSRGVLPVVIHGSEGFDVEAIDPASIGLSREGVDVVVPPLRWSYEDVGTPNFNGELCACDDLDDEEVDEDDPMGDGCMDLKLKFSVPALVEALGLAELGREKGMPRETILLTLVATAADGAQVMGQDCVQIINNWKWWEGPKGPNRPEEPNLPEKPKGPKGPKRK